MSNMYDEALWAQMGVVDALLTTIMRPRREAGAVLREFSGIGMKGNNSVNDELAYAPPRSKGPGEKKYTLTLYALSAAPKVTVRTEEVSRDVLLAAMQGSILATAELNVVYTRELGTDEGAEKRDSGRRPEEKGPPPRGDGRKPPRKPRPDGAEQKRFFGRLFLARSGRLASSVVLEGNAITLHFSFKSI